MKSMPISIMVEKERELPRMYRQFPGTLRNIAATA
jgi:hypothetical protein